MKPRIAITNLFGQDAERLRDFATRSGFEGIDWSLERDLSERAFTTQMKRLSAFEVRFHCALPGIDFAYADSRSERSMDVLTQAIRRVALVGGKHMTVHTGFGHVPEDEIDFSKALSNLAILVARGAEEGVRISLENLASHWTSDPELFATLVAHSSAGVTLDLGHAHVVNAANRRGTVYERYIRPHRDKIINAHVYYTERAGTGHVAPQRLEDISDRLDLLRRVVSCSWWVIELEKENDVLHTRDLLTRFLSSPSGTSPPEKIPKPATGRLLSMD